MNRKKYSVRKMCRALGIPQCSYYQWSQQETARAERKVREERLVQKVRDTFEENHRVYGCPKMQAVLHDKGVEVKEWKLRRIMRENGLYPVTLRKWKPYRKGKCDGMYAQNLLQRNFAPFCLNQYWCGDITYIRTNLGKHENLVFHSDRGTQYGSRDGELLRQLEEGIFHKPRVARTNSFVLMTEAQN